MKYIHLSLILFLFGFISSCGGNDDTPAESQIPIQSEFLPSGISFDTTDKNFYDVCRQWSDTHWVVNSAKDLPKDPIGFTDSYKNINYSQYSLLIVYRLHNCTIDTYSNGLIKNNLEDTYNWTISIGSSDLGSDNYDTLTFTRFAIKVEKVPDDANLKVWWNFQNLAYDHEK